MPVSYKVVSKRPGGMAGPRAPKYYPALTKRRIMHTRELAEQISGATSFTTADVFGIIEALVSMVPHFLQDGRNIQLDNFGTFSIHVSGKGRDHPSKVTSRDITGVKLAFLPSKQLKKKLRYTKFVKTS